MLGIMMVMTITSISYNAQHEPLTIDYHLIDTKSVSMVECAQSAYEANSKYPLEVGSMTIACAPDVTVPYSTDSIKGASQP